MYDSNKADKVIRFIERVCTHVKGDLATKPFILEQWQIDYIKELFGTVNEDGTRQYRTSFVFIPPHFPLHRQLQDKAAIQHGQHSPRDGSLQFAVGGAARSDTPGIPESDQGLC